MSNDYDDDSFEEDVVPESTTAPIEPLQPSVPLWLSDLDFKAGAPSGSRDPPRAAPAPQPQPAAASAPEATRTSRRHQSAASGAKSLDALCDTSVSRVTLEDVELHGEPIAGGGFALVYLGQWMHTPVAVKRIFDPVLTENLKREFLNEVNLLARLRHPNIVSLLGVCPHPPALMIVTEYMPNGNLHQLLHESRSRITTDMQLRFALESLRVRMSRH